MARAVSALASCGRTLAPSERRQVLGRAADLVREREAELARLISGEAGMCLRDTGTEVRPARANLEVAAEESVRVRGGTRYGLQAGVMTRDFEAFAFIARRLRVGGVALGLGRS